MRVLVGVAAALLASVAGGCAPSGPERSPRLPEPEQSSPTSHDLSDATMWLSFEDTSLDYDGRTVYLDALGGHFDGRVVKAEDGSVERVPGPEGSGQAVAFPAKCAAVSDCPRALIEVAPDPALDPGEREFEYGASVWLAPDQTTTGSNIVQKGRFAASDSLWKLQVDSDEGEPSCVMRSGPDLLRVRSRVSISDAAWHRVVCQRGEDSISISVDGTVERRAGRIGSIASTWPVRIGAPGVGEGDDQFHGRVDDVYLRIEPAG
jgi:hypothetical protein